MRTATRRTFGNFFIRTPNWCNETGALGLWPLLGPLQRISLEEPLVVRFPFNKKKTDRLHKTAVGATFSYAKTTAHYSKIWPRTNVKVRNKQMLLRNRGEEHKERIYSGGFVVCRCTRCIAGICGQQTAVYDWPRKIMARCVLTGGLRWEVQGGFVLPSQESVSVRSWEVQFKIIQHPSQSTSKQPEQFLQLSNLQTTIWSGNGSRGRENLVPLCPYNRHLKHQL